MKRAGVGVGVDAARIERFARLGGEEVGPDEARAGAEEWATVEALAKCLEFSAVLVDPSLIRVDGSVMTLEGPLGRRAARAGVDHFRRDMWLANGHVVVALEAVGAHG